MTLVVISVDRNELPESTDKEFERWINFNIGAIGYIGLDNPLVDIDLKAKIEEWG